MLTFDTSLSVPHALYLVSLEGECRWKVFEQYLPPPHRLDREVGPQVDPSLQGKLPLQVPLILGMYNGDINTSEGMEKVKRSNNGRLHPDIGIESFGLIKARGLDKTL